MIIIVTDLSCLSFEGRGQTCTVLAPCQFIVVVVIFGQLKKMVRFELCCKQLWYLVGKDLTFNGS